MFDIFAIFSALAPVAVKAGEALIQRYIVPDNIKPANMAEVIQLAQIENQRFQTLQDADKGGDTYQWVEAVRKLQRPLVVAFVVGAYITHPDNQQLATLAACVTFYLFGERVMFGGKK